MVYYVKLGLDIAGRIVLIWQVLGIWYKMMLNIFLAFCAIDYPEWLVSEMTCNVSYRILNSAHSLTHSVLFCRIFMCLRICNDTQCTWQMDRHWSLINAPSLRSRYVIKKNCYVLQLKVVFSVRIGRIISALVNKAAVVGYKAVTVCEI